MIGSSDFRKIGMKIILIGYLSPSSKFFPIIKSNWFNKLPRHFVKSITFDNGKEFAGWREIANKYDLHIYFAEVGAPNQRGLNENNNGLLRRDGLSKKLDFRDLPDELVTQLMHRRNNIPRKSLNYRTPLEVFLSHVTEEQLSPFF